MALSPTWKSRWAAALRSGDYVQGRGALRRGDRHCHLGVLCDLLHQEGKGEWDPCAPLTDRNLLFRTRVHSSWRELPIDLARKLGVSVDPKAVRTCGEVLLLSRLNDFGTPFEAMAKLISESTII